ncbi:MAG: thioredoxin fold domain-containing protein [Candidatus Margulisbacteria bacterium]|nr:thioredoxin fold domain-containing protein [Candidatus Margulisiibacteriota bacterium]MBU1616764.1 thioredoxin fold domain-containing protein [Candidatus Margulisiibacteriota bacterium]
MAKEISDQEFAVEVEQGKGVAFVDFWAPWCGPCLAMAPVYESVSAKYPAAKFFKVNTTEHVEKAGQYGVTGIPCIIIFKDGKEIDRLIGMRPAPAFEAAVKKIIEAK